ncbi:MAG TPA: hypothetical protein VJH03_06295 [Blastocatellia bacterium]|nr:hypothetical protein [Blastocatellia bacterium]
MQSQSRTGIEVKTSFFPLAFLLFLCTPTIVIDGAAHRAGWGTYYFDAAPGNHHVKIFFKYLFMSECGGNSINVMVQPGRVSRIKYHMPPWMLAKGSIKEV